SVVLIIGSLIHHISPSAGQYALVLLVSILAGAVFLSLGQALVGLVKSADSVQAVARVLFAGVLNLHAWDSHDTLSVLACLGYIVVFAGIGIRWFQWDARCPGTRPPRPLPRATTGASS